jgi:hypothetical protein
MDVGSRNFVGFKFQLEYLEMALGVVQLFEIHLAAVIAFCSGYFTN